MNLFFAVAANLGKQKVISMIFGWMWQFSSWDPINLLYLKSACMDWADFLQADCYATVFG